MTIDDADLKVRLQLAQEKAASLELLYQALQAQAFALLWHVPGDVEVARLQQMRTHMDQVLVEASRWRARKKKAREDFPWPIEGDVVHAGVIVREVDQL